MKRNSGSEESELVAFPLTASEIANALAWFFGYAAVESASERDVTPEPTPEHTHHTHNRTTRSQHGTTPEPTPDTTPDGQRHASRELKMVISLQCFKEIYL